MKVTSWGHAHSETQSHVEDARGGPNSPVVSAFPQPVLIRVCCKEQLSKTGQHTLNRYVKYLKCGLNRNTRDWSYLLCWIRLAVSVLTGCLLQPFLLCFPAASLPQTQASSAIISPALFPSFLFLPLSFHLVYLLLFNNNKWCPSQVLLITFVWCKESPVPIQTP